MKKTSIPRFGLYIHSENPNLESGFIWGDSQDQLRDNLATHLSQLEIKQDLFNFIGSDIPKSQKAREKRIHKINSDLASKGVFVRWYGDWASLSKAKEMLPHYVIAEFACSPSKPTPTDFRLLYGNEVEKTKFSDFFNFLKCHKSLCDWRIDESDLFGVGTDRKKAV